MQGNYQTNRRQLYILPTKIGWAFGCIIFALLIAAIKFSHQPTFLLTFLLASIGQITSLYTHKNLLKIQLSAQTATPVFAGETAFFPLTISNPSKNQRHAVWLLCGDYKKCFSLNANESKQFHIEVPATQRGILPLPDIILSSQFPIGILFSWSKAFASQQTCIVYPQPKSLLAMPLLSPTADDSAHSNTQQNNRGSEEFSSLKPYQTGDRPRDIHWPSLAKHQQLVSKEFTQTSQDQQVFEWQQVQTLNTEDKLSQLTHWILQAEQQQLPYQLNIPNFCSDYQFGPSQQNNCLSELAQWQIVATTNNATTSQSTGLASDSNSHSAATIDELPSKQPDITSANV